MERKILVALLALCFTTALSAQNYGRLAGLAMQVASRFLPERSRDSSYVFKPQMRWSVGLENTLIRTDVDLTSDITVTDYTLPTESTVHALFETSPQDRLYKKVGGYVAYGSIKLGYGVEVGKKSPGRNKYFSLSLSRPSFGGSVQYYKIHEYIDASLAIDGLDEPYLFPSDYPGLLRNMAIDAYYVFNNKRFVYNATNGGTLLQRRTVGSWMLAARFLQGDIALNQDDELFLSITSGLSKYGTQQAMLGGGYSVNWVPLHRNPENPRNGKGLRNLTLNATLLPMLSYYNHIVSEAKTEQGGTITTRFNGNLSLAVTAKAGLGFSWDRYFLNAMVIYNHFGFKNASNTVWQDDGNTRNDIDTKARFFDLTAKIQFSVKF